jgi:hypothetical protein
MIVEVVENQNINLCHSRKIQTKNIKIEQRTI